MADYALPPWLQFDPAQRLNSAIASGRASRDRERQLTDSEGDTQFEEGRESTQDANTAQDRAERSKANAAFLADMTAYQSDLAAGVPPAQAVLKHPIAFSGRLPAAAFAQPKAVAPSPQVQPPSAPAANPFSMGNTQVPPPPPAMNMNTGQPILSPPKTTYDSMGDISPPPGPPQPMIKSVPGTGGRYVDFYSLDDGKTFKPVAGGHVKPPPDELLSKLKNDEKTAKYAAAHSPSDTNTRAALAAQQAVESYMAKNQSPESGDGQGDVLSRAKAAVAAGADKAKVNERLVKAGLDPLP